MNDQMKGLLYFYMTSARYSFIIFWSILLGLLGLTLGLGYLLKGTDGVMNFNFSFPIAFYLGIYGFLIVKSWLPFMIKIGATRKNIFFSLGIFFTGVSILFSTVASLIQTAVTPLINKLGLDIFYFSHLSLLYIDTWYARIFIDASIALFLFSGAFVIALLFYRYGLAIGLGFIGLIVLGIMFSMFKGWIPNFVINVLPNINLSLFGYIALIAVVIYCLSWLLMRRATTITAR